MTYAPYVLVVLLVLTVLALCKRVRELRKENDALRSRLHSYRLAAMKGPWPIPVVPGMKLRFDFKKEDEP